MNGLVFIKGKEAVCDSLQVAEHFGKRHDKLLSEIERMYGDLIGEGCTRNGGAKYFTESTYENRGKQYPKYIMNRDGFTLLVMGFTGKEAIEWKLKYIEAFNHMEELLRQKQTQLWQDSRALSRQVRQQETDVIKVFVDYAIAQGSQHAGRYYTSFSRLADKVAGITDRDNAPFEQLQLLVMVENIIRKCITEGIDLQEPYKDIYTGCKFRLEQFRQIAMIA